MSNSDNRGRVIETEVIFTTLQIGASHLKSYKKFLKPIGELKESHRDTCCYKYYKGPFAQEELSYI